MIETVSKPEQIMALFGAIGVSAVVCDGGGLALYSIGEPPIHLEPGDIVFEHLPVLVGFEDTFAQLAESHAEDENRPQPINLRHVAIMGQGTVATEELLFGITINALGDGCIGILFSFDAEFERDERQIVERTNREKLSIELAEAKRSSRLFSDPEKEIVQNLGGSAIRQHLARAGMELKAGGGQAQAAGEIQYALDAIDALTMALSLTNEAENFALNPIDPQDLVDPGVLDPSTLADIETAASGLRLNADAVLHLVHCLAADGGEVVLAKPRAVSGLQLVVKQTGFTVPAFKALPAGRLASAIASHAGCELDMVASGGSLFLEFQ